MNDEVPPTLEYGRPETQFGVTIEHPPDGGVVVTVPAGLGRRPGRYEVGFRQILQRLFPNWLKPLPPRAVVRLTAEGLSITEALPDMAHDPFTRAWPLHEVGEVRANRYGRGLYVRIPGKENFDALVDVDERLVELIGPELEQALDRLRQRR